MAFYRPQGKTQYDGSPHASANCTPTSFAIAFDHSSLGAVNVTGAQVRSWSNEPVPDPSSPGLHLGQGIDVARIHLGITMTNRSGSAFEDLVAALASGRGAVIQYLYGSLPAMYRAPGETFTGGHASYVSQLDSTGRLLFYDPLRKDGAPRWVPPAAIKAAMTAWSKKTNMAGVSFAVTRVVPKVAS